MSINWDSVKTIAAHVITAAGAIVGAFGLADASTVTTIGDSLQTIIGAVATVVGLVMGVLNDKATSKAAAASAAAPTTGGTTAA